MGKIFTGIYIKPGIGINELKKYGFVEGGLGMGFTWRPSFTCYDYEKDYYREGEEYSVYIMESGLIVLHPNKWFQLSGKIQTLLFDMFTDGIVEKKTYEYGFNYMKEVAE